MLRPLLPVLLSFMAGITAGCTFSFPESFMIAALSLSCILLLVSTVNQWKRLGFSVTCVSICMLGILNVHHDLHAIPGTHDISRFANCEKMTIEGIVTDSPRVFPERAELIIETTKIIEARRIVPVEGRILLSLNDNSGLPDYGDLIRFKTKLKPPRNFNNPGGFDYVRHMRMKGIRLRGTLDKTGFVVIRTGDGNPLKVRLEKFRNTLRTSIRENAGSPEGEIIQAMILGEQSEIPREVMDKFSQTGTTHIIAISGFNIGIIAAFSFFIIKALMKSSEYLLLRFNIVKVSTLFAFIPIIFYAFIAGFGISVIRATLMIAAFLMAILFGRERDLVNTLVLAALVILIFSPLALFDVSFQLSFAAVASILFIVPRLTSFLHGGHSDKNNSHPWLKKAFSGFILFMAASFAATLGAAPLIVYYFNLVSVITLLANLLIVPIMGYLVILIGMAVILTAPVSNALTVILVKISSYLTGLSISVADFLSRLPNAYTFISTPTLPELTAYYLLLIAVIKLLDLWREKREPDLPKTTETGKALLKVSFCILILFFVIDGVCLYYKDRHPGLLRTSFIDVGQGNSALIDFSGGTKMLLDGGGFYDERFDIGRHVLAPFLWHEKISRIDIVVLSHPHPDHLNGLLYVLEHFNVREVWSNGDEEDSDAYDRFRRIIEKKGIPHRIMNRDSRPVMIGGARIQVLHPGGRMDRDSLDTNDRSLVMKITFGDVGILLPGDISEIAESLLLDRRTDLKSRILLAPHHGSGGSSSIPFIGKVRPDTVVFSCGAGNIFRLPHPGVLERYRHQGSRIFRTDRNGAVQIETDGKEIRSCVFRET
jgi:competence protein ComEC